MFGTKHLTFGYVVKETHVPYITTFIKGKYDAYL